MRYKKGVEGWMAIKVDLEKAYDRLRWDFIEGTLKDAGLPSKFVQAVMLCISSCSMQILWNGQNIEDLIPTRGVRQGDPLSPYIFVLCMERLSQVIMKKVHEQCWTPIILGRAEPPLSHLFFCG